MYCSQCGQGNPPDARFCGKCGTQLVAPKEIKCLRCATVSPPGNRFCTGCGAELGQPSATGAPKPSTPPPASPSVQPAQPPGKPPTILKKLDDIAKAQREGRLDDALESLKQFVNKDPMSARA